MVGPLKPLRRDRSLQLPLYRVRCLSVGQAQPVSDPEDVGIHRHGGLDPQLVEHHAGCLATDTGQGLQRLAVQGDLAAVLVDQDPGQGQDVLRLVPEQPDRADEVRETSVAWADRATATTRV